MRVPKAAQIDQTSLKCEHIHPSSNNRGRASVVEDCNLGESVDRCLIVLAMSFQVSTRLSQAPTKYDGGRRGRVEGRVRT